MQFSCMSFFFQLPHIVGFIANFSQHQMLGKSVLFHLILALLFCFILFELQQRILCLLLLHFFLLNYLTRHSRLLILGIKLSLLPSSFHDKPRPDPSLVAIAGSLRLCMNYLLYFTDSKMHIFSHFYLFEIMS